MIWFLLEMLKKMKCAARLLDRPEFKSLIQLTLFHMTMGQYDPDCPSLSFIATISVLGFKNSWLCSFWNFVCPSKAISWHYFPKKLKSCTLKNLGGLRALGESKRRFYITMDQYDPELNIEPDKVQYCVIKAYWR